MILVDTSILVDFFRGAENEKVTTFMLVLNRKIPFGISPYTYQELLQGAKNEHEFKRLREYLSTQRFYFLPEHIKAYEEAARIFYDLRRQGITVRSTIDVLIALTAIKHGLFLLHNDKDFDHMKIIGLKTMSNL